MLRAQSSWGAAGSLDPVLVSSTGTRMPAFGSAWALDKNPDSMNAGSDRLLILGGRSQTGETCMKILSSRRLGRGLTLVVSMSVLGALLIPVEARADTAADIKAEIIKTNSYTRKNLKDMDSGISSKGSLQFWSSGGLIQQVGADSPAATYTSFSLTPKHIEVITLEEGKSAVAMYYSEGGFQEEGAAPVAHYMTRITEVYVMEGNTWKVRAAHYSPIAAGSGTQQTAVD